MFHTDGASLFAALLAFAVVTSCCVARADQMVTMKREDASPALMSLAHKIYDKDFQADPPCVRADAGDVADPSCPPDFRLATVERDIAKGEAALSDFGVQEIFFVEEYSCGSAGCGMKVLQRHGGKWRTLLDGNAAVPMLAAQGGVDEYIRILDKKDRGYRRICSSFLYIWNGKEYGEVFVSKDDEENDRPVNCE